MCSADQMYWSSKCSLVINSYWSSAFMNGNVDIVVRAPAVGASLHGQNLEDLCSVATQIY